MFMPHQSYRYYYVIDKNSIGITTAGLMRTNSVQVGILLPIIFGIIHFLMFKCCYIILIVL